MRRGRTCAVLGAAVLVVALLGGCSASSSKTPAAAKPKPQPGAQQKYETARQKSLNAQDQAVRRAQQPTLAQNRARLIAALRKKWQEQANNGINVRLRHASARARSETVVDVIQTSGPGICAKVKLGPRGATKAQREARHLLELRRRQVLSYLNLSCPAA